MDTDKITSELQYKAVRSSGSGGQNVNKVASKVVLTFDVNASQGLSDEEKARLKSKLNSRLTTDSLLILNGEEDRSQLKNKKLVTQRFFEILKMALVVPKTRKATKIPRAAIEKRIKDKRNASEIKQSRKKPNY
ncbi:aminoacyl-tRNA hydrolase [Flavobacterium sp. CYK-4]|uniref:alternative ribosome rescue aminoacyl-tRNA hydrolase ArfB n=1 Tax=Flavobacterium lotistagni TaxID=2709660 RepID=UPI001409BEF7|nr:alternative ribosome rescue aminoacyl-tRNA hydrolase ArfB [Flavobacterium lotistagni]NHM05909.1 aminoacyl-tRNA hydrolase [Flavobacterium lotistagni]